MPYEGLPLVCLDKVTISVFVRRLSLTYVFDLSRMDSFTLSKAILRWFDILQIVFIPASHQLYVFVCRPFDPNS